MLKQESSPMPSSSQTASQTADASANPVDELHHVMISVCDLGPELFQRFRAANPNWKPPPLATSTVSDGEHSNHKSCTSCAQNLQIKPPVSNPQSSNMASFESPAQITLARPLSISFAKTPCSTEKPTLTVDGAMPLIQVSQSPELGNPIMIKASHPRAEDMIMKVSFMPTTASTEREVHEVSDHDVKREDQSARKPQLIMKRADVMESSSNGGASVSELGLVPHLRVETVKKNGVPNEEPVRDGYPQRENVSSYLSRPSSSSKLSPAEPLGMSKSPKYAGPSVRVEEPAATGDQDDLFDYIVASRKIPDGVSLSQLPAAMQRRLQTHYKNYCPPCPHCNTNTYVKFRYFNNSGKSSLLQPRYTCRNPDTCLTVQEKTGKAGSRDFTLPRPRDADNYGPKLPAGFAVSPRMANGQVNGQANMQANGNSPGNIQGNVQGNFQGKPVARQPQMIARIGAKRPHDLNSPTENFERNPKLPNTTLSLQSLSGTAAGIEANSNNAIVRVGETSKPKNPANPVEDSRSSSSTTQTASDDQMDVDVKCQATSSDNGRLIVQPISVQKMVPATQAVESATIDRPKGKIAE